MFSPQLTGALIELCPSALRTTKWLGGAAADPMRHQRCAGRFRTKGMENWRTPLLPVLIALAFSGAVQAETFTVTRFDDHAPDGCVPADCSLREAAMAADDNDRFDPTDVIVLGAGNYALVRGQLPLHQNLIVQGAGSSITHVSTDAPLLTGNDLSLDLRGVAIQTSDFNVVAIGNNGTLTLDDVATPPGGGTVQVSDIESDLEIRNSDLRDGAQCNQRAGACSIIDSQLSSLYLIPSAGPGPTLTFSGSVLDGALNTADTLTGMVVHRATLVDIADSTITRTKKGFKDVGNALTVRVRRLNYAENAAPVSFGRNGTLQNAADIEIIDSVFTSNSARAIRVAGQSTLLIRGTSFVSNQVNGNAGGAIVAEDTANLNVENSTFAGNTFTVDAAQAGARGAAIGYRNGAGVRIGLRHVTVTQPAFAPVGIQGFGIGGYGDVGEVVVDIYNSILAASCRLDSGALQQAVGNVESPGNSCQLGGLTNQINVTGASLALGPLRDNGGPTLTREPAITSVAVNVASSTRCLSTDQRGYQRPYPNASSGCDIGAVEVGADERIFANGFQ